MNPEFFLLSLLPTYDWYLREKIVSLVFIPDSYPYIFVAGRWDLTAVIGVSLRVRTEILAFLKVLGSQVAAEIRVLFHKLIVLFLEG